MPMLRSRHRLWIRGGGSGIFTLPKPKPLAPVEGSRFEAFHAHNVTQPQSPSRDNPRPSMATEGVGTLSARIQEKLQCSLSLYPNVPMALPELELLFGGLIKQKHPEFSRQ